MSWLGNLHWFSRIMHIKFVCINVNRLPGNQWSRALSHEILLRIRQLDSFIYLFDTYRLIPIVVTIIFKLLHFLQSGKLVFKQTGTEVHFQTALVQSIIWLMILSLSSRILIILLISLVALHFLIVLNHLQRTQLVEILITISTFCGNANIRLAIFTLNRFGTFKTMNFF